MALVNCAECKKEISSEAKACPGCGAKPVKNASWIWYVIGAMVLYGVIKGALDTGSSATASNSSSAPLSAEQIELNQKLKELEDKRFSAVYTTLTLIKKNLREPQSVQWISSDATDDGSVVCVEYRARNGFGGMNVESASSAKGIIRTGPDAWNKNCAGKSLRNMKFVQRAID